MKEMEPVEFLGFDNDKSPTTNGSPEPLCPPPEPLCPPPEPLRPPPLPRGRKRGKKKKTKELYVPLLEKALEGKDEEAILQLRHANEILQDIMKLKNIMFFYEKPNEDSFGMSSYYEVIKEPIWLSKIKINLDEGVYMGLPDFLRDVRLCLENCYKFWGVDHRISRKGLIIEQKLEQKLKELPIELLKKINENVPNEEEVENSINFEEEVEKSSFEEEVKNERNLKADSPVDEELVDIYKSDEDNTMDTDFGDSKDSDYNDDADDEDFNVAEDIETLSTVPYKPPDFKSKIMEKMLELKNEEEAEEEEDEEELRKMLSWEREIVTQDIDSEIRRMSELAEIGHFLKLTHEVLNVEEISQFEVERMLLLPRESMTLQTLMTSMLTPEIRRQALDGSPLMPYEVWTSDLKKKVDRWFYHYFLEGDRVKAFIQTGISPYFWNVVQHLYPLSTKSFHEEISFYQRVHILKALCDNILHTNKTIQDVFLEEKSDSIVARSISFGKDNKGNHYFALPFSPEIRIYRESKCLSKNFVNWKTFDGYFDKLEKFHMEFRWNEDECCPYFGPNENFLMIANDRDSLVAVIDDLFEKEQDELSDKIKQYLNETSTFKNEGLKALYRQWNKYAERPPEYFIELSNSWMSTQKPAQSETKAKTEFEKIASDELVLGKRRKASIRYMDMDYSDSEDEVKPKRVPRKRKKKNQEKDQEKKEGDQESEKKESTPSSNEKMISEVTNDVPILIDDEPETAPVIRCVPLEKMKNDNESNELKANNSVSIVNVESLSTKSVNGSKNDEIIDISSSDDDKDVEVTGVTMVKTIVVGSGQKSISQQLMRNENEKKVVRQIGSVSIERVVPQASSRARPMVNQMPSPRMPSPRMLPPRMASPRMARIPSPRGRTPSPRMQNQRMMLPRTQLSPRARSMTSRQLFPSPKRPVPAPMIAPPDSIIGTLTAGTEPDGSIKIRVTLEDGGIINLSQTQLDEIRRQHGGLLPQKVKIPLS